jgi:hypothetical protein
MQLFPIIHRNNGSGWIYIPVLTLLVALGRERPKGCHPIKRHTVSDKPLLFAIGAMQEKAITFIIATSVQLEVFTEYSLPEHEQ